MEGGSGALSDPPPSGLRLCLPNAKSKSIKIQGKKKRTTTKLAEHLLYTFQIQPTTLTSITVPMNLGQHVQFWKQEPTLQKRMSGS